TGSPLINNGTLRSQVEGGNLNYLEVNLTNNPGATVNDASGELRQDQGTTTTNDGTVTVGAAGHLTLTTGAALLTNSSGGSVSNSGAITLTSGASWTQAGGAETGSPVTMFSGTLTDSGTGSGSFTLIDNPAISGTIGPSETVELAGTPGHNATATLHAPSVTNNGTLVLDSQNLGGYGDLTGSPLINNGTLRSQVEGGNLNYLEVNLTNNPGATVNDASGELRQDEGTTTTNDGTIAIGTAGHLNLTTGAAVLNQQPDGTLTFDISGASAYGTITLSGGASINVNGGTANPILQGGYTPPIGTAFDVITGPHGTGTFTAVTGDFLGDTSNAGFIRLTVLDHTGIALGSSVNPAVRGQAVTLTATIAPSPGGSGTPTGTVAFYDNGSQIGTGTVSTTGGVTTAQFTTSSLAAGSHPMTASYSGDDNYGHSSTAAALGLQVNRVSTTTSLQSSANPSTAGHTVTFTATIAHAAGAGTDPTGTVTFYDNGRQIGAGPVSSAGAVTTAQLATSALAEGSHAVTASYPGDGNYAASASTPALNQVVQSATGLHELTISTTAGGGSVSVAGASCSGNCTQNFTPGSVVTLIATPAAGWTFAGWSGGDCVGTDPCTLKMSSAQNVTATFVHAPPPVFRQTSDVGVVSGSVRIRLPGSRTFVPLTNARQIPIGALIDATHGVVQVVLAKRSGGTLEGQYSTGEFKLSQARNGYVTATLEGANFSTCPRVTAHHAADAHAARGRPHRKRQLWSNVHGTFTTQGNSASGTVRGTEWLTTDYCEGTGVRVVRGAVLVTDLRRHRSKLVSAGHSIFVAA
ncbi:MAG TPA: Ig-like domain repeat protein, partial [Solirubrobacteraceae bacterium]|nr:Ig-like domain repeat protein [Solirubrobacteraceae bacterium]